MTFLAPIGHLTDVEANMLIRFWLIKSNYDRTLRLRIYVQFPFSPFFLYLYVGLSVAFANYWIFRIVFLIMCGFFVAFAYFRTF